MSLCEKYKDFPMCEPVTQLLLILFDCCCFLIYSKLLETLFVLLASPLTARKAAIFGSVRDIVEELMKTQSGLLFIASNVDTANGLIRLFLQTSVSVLKCISVHHRAQARF